MLLLSVIKNLYDKAWMADEGDRSVVLAVLQVAFLGKRDD